MRINYLATSWQGFIQQIVYYVSKGYIYFCVCYIPKQKLDKAYKTDEKLINKYNMDMDKCKRARQKKKGIANFVYLRWQHIAIIMHSKGEVPPIDDKFQNIRKINKISIPVSETTVLEIFNNELKSADNVSYSVKLSKETYRNIRADVEEYLRVGKRDLVIKTFNNLNFLPCWKGIVKQKCSLKKFIIRRGKFFNINFSQEDLFVYTRRIPVKVFSSS